MIDPISNTGVDALDIDMLAPRSAAGDQTLRHNLIRHLCAEECYLL